MCTDVFGPKFNKELLESGIQQTLQEYGGLDISVSNVVFVHGSLDPWHALGILEDKTPSSPAIVINGYQFYKRISCLLICLFVTFSYTITYVCIMITKVLSQTFLTKGKELCTNLINYFCVMIT